jgi:hypothetical protein
MAGLIGGLGAVRPAHLALDAAAVVLLVLFNIGGMISMTQMADLMNTPLYLAVSLFLAFTSVFFAAVIEARPTLYRPIFLAWILAAVSTATLGILGYFGIMPGAEVFTRYDRAAGAFEDPNVFGPFLTLPGIYLLYRLMTGRARADAGLRRASADHRRGHLPVLLARRMGPVRRLAR